MSKPTIEELKVIHGQRPIFCGRGTKRVIYIFGGILGFIILFLRDATFEWGIWHITPNSARAVAMLGAMIIGLPIFLIFFLIVVVLLIKYLPKRIKWRKRYAGEYNRFYTR